MEQRTFSQVLKETNVDTFEEYNRLFTLFNEQQHLFSHFRRMTLREQFSGDFMNNPIRGTCISLDDFDKTHGFQFNRNVARMPEERQLNLLVRFCEYTLNLIYYPVEDKIACNRIFTQPNDSQPAFAYLFQVFKVIDKIGYMPNQIDGIIDFVPKNPATISVSEIVDPDLAHILLEYEHHSMKGNLLKKRSVLLTIENRLEAQRGRLKQINSLFSDDLFFLFNNLNIRHNNTDSESKSFLPSIAKMGQETLEHWYDEVYNMCLLAFLELDHVDRKARIKQLKAEVSGEGIPAKT